MPNFLTDNTTLPAGKSNKRAVPAGEGSQHLAASEWNDVVNGATDLRNFLRAQVPVNLRAVGFVPRDPAANNANITALQALADAAKAASRPLVLYADDFFYIDKLGVNWSLNLEGVVDLAIVGNGRYSSGFIQHGTGTGNDWFGIRLDRCKRVALHNFGIYQGEIGIPSTGQHDHLIQIANFGGSTESCEVSLSGMYLGKCLGDAINFYGGTGKVGATIRDIDIDGYGFVLKTWQPLTAYAFGAMVRIGTVCYYATTGGVSSSVQPSTTGAGIVDGTVVWSTVVGGATYRFAARSGMAFQRGYDGIHVEGFRIKGIQNSGVDMESTGNGTCKHAHFANGVIDNGTASPDPVTGHKGNTATIFSFSGSGSMTDPTEYSSLRNITLINGSMQIAETRHARISNVRIVQDEAPQGDTGTANMYALRDNEGLVLDSIQLHRRGTSAAGQLLNIQGTGKITLSGAWVLEQTTDADLISADSAGSDICVDGTFRVKASCATPASRSVFVGSAVSASFDRPKLSGFRLESTTGAMKALFNLATRNGLSMQDIEIVGNSCKSGSLLTIARFDKQAGTTMDANPIIQGNNCPGATLFEVVDDGGAPLTNAVFPLISGNKQGQYELMGTVTPTGNVRAPQGTIYTWINGDATKRFIKTVGTNKGGWSEITGLGAASVVGYEIPTTSAEFTSFLANNALGAYGWEAPDLAYVDDGAGNLTPTIGAIDLVAAGTPSYGNAESGYTLTSLGLDDNEADSFATASASLPDPANTSMLSISVMKIGSVPAASRSWCSLSESNQVRLINSGGNARARIFYTGNDQTPAVDLAVGSFRVWFEQVNETANTSLFANDDFKFEPAYISAGSSVKRLGFGAFDQNSPALRVLVKYVWLGAKAERTKAALKAFGEAMGAGVAWVP